MARRERKYEWFVEPLDSHTNKVISENVGAENFCHDFPCHDEQKRNLWRCPSAMVFMLWRSKKDLALKFKVYSRELPGGQIRDCTTWYRNANRAKQKNRLVQGRI